MNLSRIVIAGALSMAMPIFAVQAAEQGQGVVNFKGTVIDAPCGISPGSADQTIDFGQLSKAQLANNGISAPQDLNIELVNCVFKADGSDNSVQVAFTGTTNGANGGELGTTGNTGTVIKVSSQGGTDVTFDGTPGDLTGLSGSNNTLNYSAYVKKGTGLTVAEGDFSAVANFNLTYQ